MLKLARNLPVLIFLLAVDSALAAKSMLVSLNESTGNYSRPDSAIKFRQITRNLKLPQKNGSTAALGGQTWAIAWGDANNNLYPDLYLNHHTRKSTQRSEVPFSHLLLDPGSPEGITSYSDLGGADQHSAIFIDINGDGQQDLFEVQGGSGGKASNNSVGTGNRVLIGKDGVFPDTSTAQEYQLEYSQGRGRNPTPLNINGQLGLIVANISRKDEQYPTTFFLQTAKGPFEERRDLFKARPCIVAPTGRPTCPPDLTADLDGFHLALPGYFNGDEYQDVIFLDAKAANHNPVQLFTGNKDGSFTASAHNGPKIRAKDGAVLDANNDGQFDLWLTGKLISSRLDHADNSLYSIDKNGDFIGQPGLVGVSDPPRKSVSVVVGDFDNDGDEDVVTYEADNKDLLFYFSVWENTADGSFQRTRYRDHKNKGFARNVAVADYNLDGALDLIFGDGKAMPWDLKEIGGYTLLEGVPNQQHWLQIDLTDPWGLRGLGARVFVTSGKLNMVRGQFGGAHKATQNHSRLHFGLGNSDKAEVSVLWADGTRTALKDVAVDQVLRISYPQEP